MASFAFSFLCVFLLFAGSNSKFGSRLKISLSLVIFLLLFDIEFLNLVSICLSCFGCLLLLWFVWCHSHDRCSLQSLGIVDLLLSSFLASGFSISGELLLSKTLCFSSLSNLLSILRQISHIFFEFHCSLSLTHIAIIISSSEFIIQNLNE